MMRTVFITGASSGFGAACARQFAAAEARLVLAAADAPPGVTEKTNREYSWH
jgi:NAD(P)-dependent dehydrogenase (short-subunit alcohol dehydrogenase family)